MTRTPKSPAAKRTGPSTVKAHANGSAELKSSKGPRRATTKNTTAPAPVLPGLPTAEPEAVLGAELVKAVADEAVAEVEAVAPAAAQLEIPAEPAVAAEPAAPAPVVANMPAPAKLEDSPELTLNELKDTIMASAPKTDNVTSINDTMNTTMTTAMTEMQSRAKAAYEKSTVAATEVTEFAKGNVEAVVESGKILAGGMQDLGRTLVEEAKTAYETVSADVKEMAAVKSPTELFQLQGKIVRRNFDMLVAASTKNSEAMMKLATEAFAPMTGRVNVAAEKLSKVA